MTSPEPSLNSAPKDPAEYRPRPLLGVGFWAMLALAVVCVLAGVLIATLGPKLLAHRPVPAAAAPALEPTPTAAAPAALPLAPNPAPAVAPAVAPADVERLGARVAALETREAHTAQAAAAALAAAAVVEASQGSAPFAEQLAALRAIAPPSPELTALARLAETGAPSRAALAASFPDYAARAASAARAPGDGAGLAERIGYALSRIVTLRRVGDVPGSGVDAVIARAERQVEDGDLDQALRTLDRLSPRAREALSAWRIGAERRAEIDRDAAGLRARALQALAVGSEPAA
jgi:hypothetical protein